MLFHVEEQKITHYLLTNPTKCGFFLKAGYTLQDWRALRDDILRHPHIAALEALMPDVGGRKLMHRCAMPTAPNGRTYCVRTIWQEQQRGTWRFLSAYPQRIRGTPGSAQDT